jgi:hypothetical protein
VFQLFQPLDIGAVRPAVLGFPLVVGRGTDAVTQPNLTNGAPEPLLDKPEKLPGYRL